MERSGFQHEALIYRGADDFLARTVPFLRDGLEAEEPTLVAVCEPNRLLLEGELGDDGDAVHFAEMEVLGHNPARIIPFWRDFVDAHRGEPVRGIGEPVWPGRDAVEIDECQRHEELLDVAFALPPAWSLLCSYDASGLDDAVLEAATHCHRTVERDGVSFSGDGDDRAPNPFRGELSVRPPESGGFEFDRTGLFDVRQRVGWAAKSAGLSATSATDLVIAASEVASNSIVHGGGRGTLHAWRDDDRLLVEVEDRGTIEAPLVGRVRPRPTEVGGRGLWLANQLCDLVQIRSGPTGTTVRLRMAVG